MRRHDDEWLKQKIEEDMIAMADKREREIMESESYQYIDMSEEKMKELRALIIQERELREAEEKRRPELEEPEVVSKPVVSCRRFHLRPVLVAAVVLVLCLGTGLVSTGSRVYIPEIFERESGNGETLKINNTEAVEREYNEEEVCAEIEEKIGVIPPRLIYKTQGMTLGKYDVWTEETEAIIRYFYDEECLAIYISKDWNDSVISNHVDGEKIDTIMIASCGLDVSVYEYLDPYERSYYEVSFEYLNTYYSIKGMMSQEEFVKIVENILIKNA